MIILTHLESILGRYKVLVQCFNCMYVLYESLLTNFVLGFRAFGDGTHLRPNILYFRCIQLVKGDHRLHIDICTSSIPLLFKMQI